MNKLITFGSQYKFGLKRGVPIALGYVPVSFAFGLMAVSGGLSPWLAIFISLSNLTSAGQFAGTHLIIQNAGYIEITLTTFVINIRYMLMSLSLSQKLDSKVTLLERLIFSFGITDETFAVAAAEKMELTYGYMMGLISGPIIGWTTGTALGAFICSALPKSFSDALGIALYGMFLAIIIPPAKHSRTILGVVLSACALSCIMSFTPYIKEISTGFRVIIVTLVVCTIGALVAPIKEEQLV